MSKMKLDVVCFGSAVIDSFVDTDIKELDKKMCYPVGEKISVQELEFLPGGGGINTSTAFSRLGLKTGLITKLGEDFNSEKILNFLKKERIKFLGCVDKKGKTGFSVVLDSKEHNRTILTHKGVNNDISYSDLNLKNISSDWLYLSSLEDKSFKTQIKTAKLLKKKGVKIAFNPSSYLIKENSLNDLIKICDILVLNKEEGIQLLKKNKRLTGENKREIANNISKMGPEIVVITDKDKPVMAYSKKEKKYFSIKPSNKKAKERTGAGDAFASGFVAGQIAGKNIKYSLKLGLKEAESVIRYLGATNKLIKKDLKK